MSSNLKTETHIRLTAIGSDGYTGQEEHSQFDLSLVLCCGLSLLKAVQSRMRLEFAFDNSVGVKQSELIPLQDLSSPLNGYSTSSIKH